MEVVELELKLKQKNEEIENLLLKQGFTILQKVRTIANYYTNIDLKNDYKNNCIRCRIINQLNPNKETKKGWRVLNLHLFDKSIEQTSKELVFDDEKVIQLEKSLLNNGYSHIITDDKTDFVYLSPDYDTSKIAFQIQDIKGIGNIIAYDNENYYSLPKEQQKEKLLEDIKRFGIEVISKDNIDRYSPILKNEKLDIKKIIEIRNN